MSNKTKKKQESAILHLAIFFFVFILLDFLGLYMNTLDLCLV